MTQPAKPINQRYVQSVTLDETGAGSVQIVPRADFACQQTSWRVQGGTGTNQSTAQVELNGDFWQGTYSGNNDSSPTARLITNNDIIECEWTGGPPGATATLTMFGLEYPAGQGIPPPANAGGPSNPILGGTTLIRDAIQSQNYIAETQGWAIFADGSIDMNNGTFRGVVDVVGSNESYVKIFDETTGIDESTATVEMGPGIYQDGYTPQTDAGDIQASAISSTKHYGQLRLESPGYNFSSTLYLIGQSGEASIAGTNDTEADLFAATVNLGIDTNSDIQIGGASIGYGWVAGGGTITSTGPIGATEMPVCTLDSAFKFRAGRRYQVVMTSSGSMSAAGRVVDRLHKGVGVAGAQLALTGHHFSNTSVGNMNWVADLYCTTAGDVTTNLTWGGTTGAAAPTATYTPNPAITMDVFDLGPSTALQRTYLQQLS